MVFEKYWRPTGAVTAWPSKLTVLSAVLLEPAQYNCALSTVAVDGMPASVALISVAAAVTAQAWLPLPFALVRMVFWVPTKLTLPAKLLNSPIAVSARAAPHASASTHASMAAAARLQPV